MKGLRSGVVEAQGRKQPVVVVVVVVCREAVCECELWVNQLSSYRYT